MSWAIGIDFGTSRSAGAIGELDQRRLAPDPATGRPVPAIMAPSVSPLEIEGNRWIPSMVLRTPEGQLVVGAAADNLAGVHPDRLERTPKRSLGTGAPLLLGEPIDPRDAAAAVIRMIVAEGRLRQGDDPRGCIVTHPVRWAGVRRNALAEAAQRAGLREVQLVDEPVAAAIHYASEHVELGGHVGVYDLGGGTFDTALLQRTDRGFEVIGVPGGDENIGGENFDHRLFRYFGSCIAESDPALWDQMMTSDDRKWKRAALDLLVQARRAKEALSSYTSTQVFVPVADRDIVVNRSQFEAMIIEDIERTVDLMEDTVVDAGLKIEQLAAVFLVGGSSRVPLVSQMVTERFGSRVVTRDEPKGVVALGAARLAALRFLVPRPAAPSQSAAATAPTTSAPAAAPSKVDAPDLDAMPVPESTARSGTEPAATEWLVDLPPPRSHDRWGEAAPAPAAAGPPPAAGRSASPPTAPGAATPYRSLADLPAPHAASAAGPAGASGAAGAARVADAPAARPAIPFGAPLVAPPGGGTVAPGSPGPAASAAVAGPSPSVHVAAGTTAAGGASTLAGAPVAIAWRIQVGDAPGQLAADEHAVAFGGRRGVVRCVDPRRGEMRWEQSVGSATWAAPALADDAVVVGTSDGRVVLLDRRTGTVRWQVSVGSPVACTPVVIEATVIVANDGGRMLGIDRQHGAVRWDLPVGAPVRAGLVATGREAVVATTAGQVYVVDAATGRPRWGYRTAGQVLLAPGVAGDRVIVPSRDGVVHVVRLADGVAVYGVRCSGAPATQVAVAGDVFAVVDDSGVLRVHRADSGRPVCEVPVATSQVAGVALVAAVDPSVAVVETGGQLVAVDLTTRLPRFSVPTGDGNRSVPAVSGGLVCVGTTFGQLYGIVAP